MARRRKQNTNDLLIYGGLGIATGFTIDFLKDVIAYYFIHKKTYTVYQDGLKEYGTNWLLFWEFSKLNILLDKKKITQEEYDLSVNDLTNDSSFDGATTEKVLEAKEYYKKNVPWIRDPESWFKGRDLIVNYGLIIAGVLPYIINLKSQKLLYLLTGAGLVGLYKVVTSFDKSYNWSSLTATSKDGNTSNPKSLKRNFVKIFDKDLINAMDTDPYYGGWIFWSLD